MYIRIFLFVLSYFPNITFIYAYMKNVKIKAGTSSNNLTDLDSNLFFDEDENGKMRWRGDRKHL